MRTGSKKKLIQKRREMLGNVSEMVGISLLGHIE
jgi:hypothetical protein